MKKILCSQMGGPAECSEVITGSSGEEMIGVGWTHIQATHPELAQQVAANPQDVNEKWMSDFKAKFDTLENA